MFTAGIRSYGPAEGFGNAVRQGAYRTVTVKWSNPETVAGLPSDWRFQFGGSGYVTSYGGVYLFQPCVSGLQGCLHHRWRLSTVYSNIRLNQDSLLGVHTAVHILCLFVQYHVILSQSGLVPSFLSNLVFFSFIHFSLSSSFLHPLPITFSLSVSSTPL